MEVLRLSTSIRVVSCVLSSQELTTFQHLLQLSLLLLWCWKSAGLCTDGGWFGIPWGIHRYWIHLRSCLHLCIVPRRGCFWSKDRKCPPRKPHRASLFRWLPCGSIRTCLGRCHCCGNLQPRLLCGYSGHLTRRSALLHGLNLCHFH